jgi:hypothetical protein
MFNPFFTNPKKNTVKLVIKRLQKCIPVSQQMANFIDKMKVTCGDEISKTCPICVKVVPGTVLYVG